MNIRSFLVLISIAVPVAVSPCAVFSGDFDQDVNPLLKTRCVRCHGGSEPRAGIDFTAISSSNDIADAFEIWESVAGHLEARTMPPTDEPQPTDQQRARFLAWYRDFVDAADARPAVFRPRRLSVTEYRNTLRSVLGFDLRVEVIEAEQTLAERSMVVKLLPVDPPGKSGFKNDTHANPLTTVVWDQYAYLIESALEELFSSTRRAELETLVGPIDGEILSDEQARALVRTLVRRAWRRPPEDGEVDRIIEKLGAADGPALVDALKRELKIVLMSPQFMYRGLLLTGHRGQQQAVDPFELAERLSYFLWADMPDERLIELAANGDLADDKAVAAQIDQMLASPKARSLSEVFAVEWLTLNEIEHVSDNPPQMVALKSQPIDFLHYLFTQDRTLLELIDSDTAFISPHTARMYGRDARQMTKYVKQRGIEVEIVPNQKITLQQTGERGGILTMPGVLAMNRGPILRGTWILERILGEELPEPPADVGQVPPNRGGEELTFRERFELHRSNASCAVCHDKIDPLGFALQTYDNGGQFLKSANYKPAKRKKRADDRTPDPNDAIDTSGRLPSGETFADIDGLKQILTTSRREVVIRNCVERTMSYALCRRLTIYDRPTVDSIVKQMDETDGTWRDLFHAVANSLPFRETILSD